MTTLQDYIKLAEKLNTVGWHEGAKTIFEAVPAMAKALIEAEAALRQIRTGCHPEFNVNRIADKALSTIQALNGGEE